MKLQTWLWWVIVSIAALSLAVELEARPSRMSTIKERETPDVLGSSLQHWYPLGSKERQSAGQPSGVGSALSSIFGQGNRDVFREPVEENVNGVYGVQNALGRE
jgi:hypothetical protein